MKKLVHCCAALAAAASIQALPVTYTYSSPVYSAAEGLIPDGGVNSFALSINSPITSILDVNIHLKISGGFNGDLGALALFGLEDTSPFASLLSGISGATSGMDIWLDDQATANIQDAGGAGFLTGTFRPEGPETLSVFNGLNPNSDIWSLLLFDNSPALESTLIQWELQITGEVPAVNVPEQIACTGPLMLIGLIVAHQILSRRKSLPLIPS